MKNTNAIAVAVAIALALGSASANAALATPGLGANAPTSATGLILTAWNADTHATEVVNLGYNFSDIGVAGFTNLNGPATGASPFALAANPTGAAGQVYQLDFGSIAGVGGYTNYMVTAGALSTDLGIAGVRAIATTFGSTPTTGTFTFTALNGAINNIQGELSQAFPTLGAAGQGSVADAPGTTFGVGGAGLLTANAGAFGGLIGSALGFYEVLGSSASGSTVNGVTIPRNGDSILQYGDGSGNNGFWFLSSGGELTYNVAAATSVPVPAALWLLGSGLLGMAGVRRRRAVKAA